ncbi:lecithin retinol acyltransferase family protein [Acinetobacter sp. ME22]|uniref:lecithin retinol acyltransferase family protein n=1 Tax=Acinetobacter sp. ME22 TaxID=2904802 RepID=UPI001EDAB1A1|nr:lecithin retinol acyltransferase family protein [Acinetobacter sp. ME22]MCG2575310.1 lecithin retinol acyltransferase family protein [Acinetobacter sp. ME22]
MNTIQLGSHLCSSRGLYDHHGIYVGDNQVIHYSGFDEAFKKGAIKKTSLESFLGGSDDFKVVSYPSYQNIYSPEEIVHRAQSCLGEDDYNLFFNNCEHFACWCVTGKARSEQVQAIMRHTTNAVFSYYAFQRYQILAATASAPITMMTTTPAVNSVLTSMALGGTVGIGAATLTTSALGTGAVAGAAAVGVIGAAGVGAAAITVAPVMIAGALIGGLFSLFND